MANPGSRSEKQERQKENVETATSGTLDPDSSSGSTNASQIGGLANVTIEESTIGAWFAGIQTERHDGVEIANVQRGGPSDLIGLKAGDVITAINDHYVFTIDQLHQELRSHHPGERLQLRFRRNSRINETFVTLIP
jgi:S1-C subfamily serine protease